MIQYLWFVVHYTMLLPDNLLDTTMTALRGLIIFMIIIHELMSNQQESGPYMYTTVHVCLSNHCLWMSCDVFVGRPNTQLPVAYLFPWYIRMHKGVNKPNLNWNLVDFFLYETYASTKTSWASMWVSSHVHHTDLGLGGSVETK